MHTMREVYRLLVRYNGLWKTLPEAINNATPVDASTPPGAQRFHVNGKHLAELRNISQGGYAYVALVKDINTGTQFALKKVPCETMEATRTAQREVTLLKRLPPHPNIVRFYGSVCINAGVSRRLNTTVCSLFEFCSGGCLLDVLRESGNAFPLNAVVDLALPIARAINHLHSQQPPITHCDIKLENILLDADGNPKLCDFGSASTSSYDTAKMSHEELLHLEDVISRTTSFSYRPPEMADLYRRDVIDTKVDIWMFGCVLYFLLFREHPFDGTTSVLTITNAAFEIRNLLDIDDFSTLQGRLIDLILWLLSPSPKDRPTAEILVAALQTCRETENCAQLPHHVTMRRNARIARLRDIHVLTQKCEETVVDQFCSTETPRERRADECCERDLFCFRELQSRETTNRIGPTLNSVARARERELPSNANEEKKPRSRAKPRQNRNKCVSSYKAHKEQTTSLETILSPHAVAVRGKNVRSCEQLVLLEDTQKDVSKTKPDLVSFFDFNLMTKLPQSKTDIVSTDSADGL